MAKLSPRYFLRVFQETYHTTPKAYITQLRIAHARTLLTHSEKPITEIAFDCGYSDSNYFSRVFKKITKQRRSGFAPRQKCWETRFSHLAGAPISKIKHMMCLKTSIDVYTPRMKYQKH